MAYESPSKILGSLVAAADLSGNQFSFVKVDTSAQVALAGNGEAAVGVLQDKPASGAVASVEVGTGAITKVKVGSAAVNKGYPAASDGSGLGKNAATGNHVMGIWLEDGAAGAIVAMLLSPRSATL